LRRRRQPRVPTGYGAESGGRRAAGGTPAGSDPGRSARWCL